MTEQSYNPEAYEELMEFLSRHALNNGDKFCADLMRESPRHKSLGMQTVFIRYAKHIYAKQSKLETATTESNETVINSP